MASSQSYAQAGNQFPNLIGNPLSLVAPNNTGDKSNGGAQSTIHTIRGETVAPTKWDGDYSPSHLLFIYSEHYHEASLNK